MLAQKESIPTNSVEQVAVVLQTKPVFLFFKRTFDILFSMLCLLFLFIPIGVICLAIVIDSPGAAPIYCQERVGKNGKKFKFYKLRSMVPHAEDMLDDLTDKNEMDGPVFKIKNDPRITRIGHFIRISSIDELPQLWNVLKGDMSFVGPRPPLPREVVQYNEYEKNRLLVTPGITCLWQIQPNRNSLSFHEWLNLDIEYINKRSAWLDLKILFKTVGAVCGLEGE